MYATRYEVTLYDERVSPGSGADGIESAAAVRRGVGASDVADCQLIIQLIQTDATVAVLVDCIKAMPPRPRHDRHSARRQSDNKAERYLTVLSCE